MRVLHVGSTLDLAGGIESFIMNLYRHIENRDIVFDFLVKEGQEEGYYSEYVKGRNGRIYAIDWRKSHLGKYIKKAAIYRKYRNDVIHIHTNCGSRVIDGMLAKAVGCRHIIFHSHTCKGTPSLKFRVLQPLFRFLGNYFWACSSKAATFFFGEKILKNRNYRLVHNAIELDKYCFDKNARIHYRSNWEIKDKYILGFVGRFSPEKNIPFVLDVFSELRKSKEAMLVMVGDGAEYSYVQNLVIKKKLENDVLMLGVRSDIAKLMSAFDGLILPSFFEGLGIVLVEAQAAGVSCYASDTIPKEVKGTSLLQFLSLEEGASEWAKVICCDSKKGNQNYYKQLVESGYDAFTEAREISELYTGMR